jgi:hypothetical protein
MFKKVRYKGIPIETHGTARDCHLWAINIADGGMGFLRYRAVEEIHSDTVSGGFPAGFVETDCLGMHSDLHSPCGLFFIVSLSFRITPSFASQVPSFFAWGVRQSITLRLHRDGMSLAAFISSVQISSRSLIRDPKKLKWTVLSTFVFSLTAAQTAGFVMLFASSSSIV